MDNASVWCETVGLNHKNHWTYEGRDVRTETEHIIQSCHAAWARFQRAQASTQLVMNSLPGRLDPDGSTRADGGDAARDA